MTLNNINAKLTIRSIQEVMGEEQASLTIEDAYFAKRGDKSYILYEEHDENGRSENKVRIIISDQDIVVVRSGLVNARLVYAMGMKTETNYRLPYGMLNVEVYTKNIVRAERENGFCLLIDYDVSMGAENLKTRLEITLEKGAAI